MKVCGFPKNARVGKKKLIRLFARTGGVGAVFVMFLAGSLFLAFPAGACDEACVKDLIVKNDEFAPLSEYRDSAEVLGAKLRHLDEINEYRKQAGTAPVGYDLLAGRVANKQAREAALNGFGGHWNMAGLSPFMRYGLNGGVDHVSENAYEKTAVIKNYKGETEECSMADMGKLLADMREATDEFMNEGEGGKHHDNILEKDHNFVGLGFYCEKVQDGTRVEFRVRYYEEFLNRYITFDDFKREVAAGEAIKISGAVSPDAGGSAYMTVSYYVSPPAELTPDEINEMPQYYRDYTNERQMVLGPGDMGLAPGGRFSVGFKADNPGFYYVQILLKRDGAAPEAGKVLTPKELIYASGIVITVH